MSTKKYRAALKKQGYTCRRERISGQGYFGGDGIMCYRVRGNDGRLVNSSAPTYQTARAAWADAAQILSGTDN